MKKVLLGGLIIIIVGVLFMIFSGRDSNNNLTSPDALKIFTAKSTPIPEATPGVPIAPTTFQFNSATDLQAELEKVNPQILDSDFE